MSVLDWFKPVKTQDVQVQPPRQLQAARLAARIERLEQAVLAGASDEVLAELTRLKEQV